MYTYSVCILENKVWQRLSLNMQRVQIILNALLCSRCIAVTESDRAEYSYKDVYALLYSGARGQQGGMNIHFTQNRSIQEACATGNDRLDGLLHWTNLCFSQRRPKPSGTVPRATMQWLGKMG